MSVTKIRTRAHIAGPLTLGANADSGLQRLGANVIGPKSGDTLAVDASTAVVGTAALMGVGGAIVLRTQAGGSPCLAFRNGGTVFSMFFATAGGAVTGTPVTS